MLMFLFPGRRSHQVPIDRSRSSRTASRLQTGRQDIGDGEDPKRIPEWLTRSILKLLITLNLLLTLFEFPDSPTGPPVWFSIVITILTFLVIFFFK